MIVDLDGYRVKHQSYIVRELGLYSYNTVVSAGFSKTNYLTSRWKSEIVKQSTMSTIIFTAYDLNQASKKKPYLNLWSNPSWSLGVMESWSQTHHGPIMFGKESTQRATDSLCEFRRLWLSKDRNIGGYRIESWVQLWSSYTTSTTLSQARNLSVLPMDAVCFTQIFVEKRLVFSGKGLLRYKTNEGMKFVQD